MDPKHSEPRSRAITEFAEFVRQDPFLCNTLDSAIGDACRGRQYRIAKWMEIRDAEHLFQAMDKLIHQGPPWTNANDGLIGCPLNSVLQPIMESPRGWMFLSRADTNNHLRRILKTWAQFLESESSTPCLLSDRNGWCAQESLKQLAYEADPHATPKPFTEIFNCPDPHNVATLGFRSWDTFFTRQFSPGIRPLGGGVDVDLHNVVLHPCEAACYRYSTNVQLADIFWLKHQPYLLMDMLDQHWSSPSFENGFVYQAFLSALSYHRWHAPVSGTVLSIKSIPGTYFSQAPSYSNWDKISPEDVDDAPPNRSQAYLASIATRLLILLQADSPGIGLVAFLAVGMAEVSSCDSFVSEGQHVRAGDEMGTFRYGGSSYCLLFEPGSRVEFVADLGTNYSCDMQDRLQNNPVRSILATVNR